MSKFIGQSWEQFVNNGKEYPRYQETVMANNMFAQVVAENIDILTYEQIKGLYRCMTMRINEGWGLHSLEKTGERKYMPAGGRGFLCDITAEYRKAEQSISELYNPNGEVRFVSAHGVACLPISVDRIVQGDVDNLNVEDFTR